jgi:hypothetical protein
MRVYGRHVLSTRILKFYWCTERPVLGMPAPIPPVCFPIRFQLTAFVTAEEVEFRAVKHGSKLGGVNHGRYLGHLKHDVDKV